MEFATFYQLPAWPNQQPEERYRDTLQQIELADRLGFDTAWVAELHFQPDYSVMPAPLLVAAGASQRTKRIRLGIGVNLLPLHDPLRLAENLAVLDVMSSGRVNCGLARAGNPEHFAGYGIPMPDRTGRFTEGVEVLKRAWATDPLSFEGKHFHYEGVNVVPKPLQQPGLPLWIASNSEETYEYAAKERMNILVSSVTHPPSLLSERVAQYKALRRQKGVPAPDTDIGLMFPVHVGRDRAKARAEAEASIIPYLRMVGSDLGGAFTKRGEEAPKRLRRYSHSSFDIVTSDMGAIGEPAEVADRVQALRDQIGAGHLMCWFNTGGLITHESVCDSMRLFAEEVIPRLTGGPVGARNLGEAP